MNIIAIVGKTGAGKSTVIEILKDMGFEAVSTSQELRKQFYIQNGRVENSREELRIFGNRVRQKENDPSYFLKLTLDNITLENNINQILIDGIRNIHEINYLRYFCDKNKRKLTIVGITANTEVRYNRLIDRKKESDPKDLSTFINNDALENGDINDRFALHVYECIKQADVVIENNFTSEKGLQELRNVILNNRL